MRGARAIPLALATLATCVGAAFLWNVGALPGMASRNVAAFVVGLAIGFGALRLSRRHRGSPLLLAGCSLLLLMALFGIEADGVRRWISFGPFTLQPALIVTPMLLALLGSEEGRKWRPWLVVPAALIALQPDAASLGALATGMAVTIRRSDGPQMLAAMLLTAALAALAIIGMRTPPPIAFVEDTVTIAVTSGAVARVLLLAAIVLMALAPLSGKSPSGPAVTAYFLVSAAIAMLWAFPMPIAGAAPSHLLGFGAAMAILADRRPALQPKT